jgi:hypothetical protein
LFVSFLPSSAAISLIPRVGEIMQKELGWSNEVLEAQKTHAREYLGTYGGPVPDKAGSVLRTSNYRDLKDIFKALDSDRSGFLDEIEIGQAAKALGFPMTPEELDEAFRGMDTTGDGRVKLEEFETWWKDEAQSPLRLELQKDFKLGKINAEKARKWS